MGAELLHGRIHQVLANHNSTISWLSLIKMAMCFSGGHCARTKAHAPQRPAELTGRDWTREAPPTWHKAHAQMSVEMKHGMSYHRFQNFSRELFQDLNTKMLEHVTLLDFEQVLCNYRKKDLSTSTKRTVYIPTWVRIRERNSIKGGW